MVLHVLLIEVVKNSYNIYISGFDPRGVSSEDLCFAARN